MLLFFCILASLGRADLCPRRSSFRATVRHPNQPVLVCSGGIPGGDRDGAVREKMPVRSCVGVCVGRYGIACADCCRGNDPMAGRARCHVLCSWSNTPCMPGLNPGHLLLSGRSRAELAMRPPVWHVPKAGHRDPPHECAATIARKRPDGDSNFPESPGSIHKGNVLVSDGCSIFPKRQSAKPGKEARPGREFLDPRDPPRKYDECQIPAGALSCTWRAGSGDGRETHARRFGAGGDRLPGTGPVAMSAVSEARPVRPLSSSRRSRLRYARHFPAPFL